MRDLSAPTGKNQRPHLECIERADTTLRGGQGIAGIGNHSACDGYDDASWIGLDGNRMIWTWEFDLLCFHVLGFLFLLVLSRSGSSSRCAQSVLDIDALLGRLAAIHKV